MPYSKYPGFLATLILSALIVFVAATVPGVSADGDDDIPEPPPKRELTYPSLGSHLSGLAEAYEEGSASQRESAGKAAMSQGGSVAVTIYLISNVADVVQFLQDNGGDPRNVGEDYIEAYVPVIFAGSGIRAARRPPGAGNRAAPAGIRPHNQPGGPSSWLPALEPGRLHRTGRQGGGNRLFRRPPQPNGDSELPATVVGRCYTRYRPVQLQLGRLRQR